VEEAPTMHRDADAGLLRRTAFTTARRARSRCRRPPCTQHPLPTSTMRTPSSAAWAAVAPGHRHVLRHLLERASRRLGEKERDG